MNFVKTVGWFLRNIDPKSQQQKKNNKEKETAEQQLILIIIKLEDPN